MIKGIFCLFLICFINSCAPYSCIDFTDKSIKVKKIEGIIIKKVSDYPCHGFLVFSSKDNKIDSLRICYCAPFQDCWDKVAEGDTILKEIGSIKISIKSNGKITTWERYPCCDW